MLIVVICRLGGWDSWGKGEKLAKNMQIIMKNLTLYMQSNKNKSRDFPGTQPVVVGPMRICGRRLSAPNEALALPAHFN